MNFLEFKVQGTKYVKKYYLNYISMLKSWLTILTRKDLKKKKLIDTKIWKNGILAAYDYCLLNQLKFHNSIEYGTVI